MFTPLLFGLLLGAARSVVGEESNAPYPTGTNGSYPTGNNDSCLHTHDGGFTPDFYLSVTYENHTVACQTRMSALVNGTSPGPELRLPAGKTSWVRVCNDMEEYNTTMVWRN